MSWMGDNPFYLNERGRGWFKKLRRGYQDPDELDAMGGEVEDEDVITFFEKPGYKGQRMDVVADDVPDFEWLDWDKPVGSIEMNPRFDIIVYDEPNYKGNHARWEGEKINYVGKAFRNSIKSYKLVKDKAPSSAWKD